MKRSAYPEYKWSGVERSGDVPSHWDVDRIKWSVQSSQNGVWGEEADGGVDDIRCVRVSDFDRPKLSIQDHDVTYRKVTQRERQGRLLTKGDLILEKSGGGEKSPVGFVVLYDRTDPAVPSNFLARVSLKPGMDPRFWTYLHSSLYTSRLTQRSIKQTSGIQNLDQRAYFDERVCFPPPTEQRVIADYLDAETARIDVLMAKQKQLIGTLRERRSAVIAGAITRGLDADVDFVESGIEWIDLLPSHWSVSKLKYEKPTLESGTSVNATDITPDDGEVGVLKTGAASKGYFDPRESKTVWADELKRVSCPVQQGSLPGEPCQHTSARGNNSIRRLVSPEFISIR